MRVFMVLTFILGSLVAQDIFFLFKKCAKSLEYISEKEAIEAQNLHRKSDLFDPQNRVSFTPAYAKADEGGSGMEYEISGGRDFFVGGNLRRYFATLDEYTGYMQRVALERLRIRLWRDYGNYCLMMRSLQAKGALGVVYDEIARHIDKGVRLGEFSASDAIMAHLSLDRLNLEISQIEADLAQIEAKIKRVVPEFDGHFICQGLRPDSKALFDAKNSLLWSLLESKTDGLRQELALYGKLRSVGVDLTFSDELDTRRGMVTLSIPLYTSSASERKRAAILKELSSTLHGIESMKNSYGHDTRVLKERLRIYVEHVSRTERSIKLSADTLIEQSRMRFRAGEESLMQMLKAIETKLSLLETILQLKLKRHNAIADYMDKYAIEIERVVR